MVPSTKELRSWDRLVDLVTVVWLGFFVVGLVDPGELVTNVQLGLLGVFVADLVVKYRRVGNLKLFFHNHWLDILMVIPYFRIFRILRLLRLLRVLKAGKLAKVGRFPGIVKLEAAREKVGRLGSPSKGGEHG